jgi:hypothetical protein
MMVVVMAAAEAAAQQKLVVDLLVVKMVEMVNQLLYGLQVLNTMLVVVELV